jgi:hypothetical protein
MNCSCLIKEQVNMNDEGSKAPGSMTWRESLRGGWLNTLAPSIALLMAILGDTLNVPGWLSAAAVVAVWFGGFFILIRVQFALHHRNAEVFRAFWRTTALGFALVAVLVMLMYMRGRM